MICWPLLKGTHVFHASKQAAKLLPSAPVVRVEVDASCQPLAGFIVVFAFGEHNAVSRMTMLVPAEFPMRIEMLTGIRAILD